MDTDLAAAARRLQLAFDLYQTGEEMMRQKLRREYPALSPTEIEARVLEWLLDRPGAELGDSCGRPVPWPRGGH